MDPDNAVADVFAHDLSSWWGTIPEISGGLPERSSQGVPPVLDHLLRVTRTRHVFRTAPPVAGEGAGGGHRASRGRATAARRCLPALATQPDGPARAHRGHIG